MSHMLCLSLEFFLQTDHKLGAISNLLTADRTRMVYASAEAEALRSEY